MPTYGGSSTAYELYITESSGYSYRIDSDGRLRWSRPKPKPKPMFKRF